MKKKKNVLLMILAAVVAMIAISVNVWAVQYKLFNAGIL